MLKACWPFSSSVVLVPFGYDTQVKILHKGVDPNSTWITGDLLDVKRVNLYLSILKDWKGGKSFKPKVKYWKKKHSLKNFMCVTSRKVQCKFTTKHILSECAHMDM